MYFPLNTYELAASNPLLPQAKDLTYVSPYVDMLSVTYRTN